MTMTPAKTPRGENHKVTIANQARQIVQLTQRLTELREDIRAERERVAAQDLAIINLREQLKSAQQETRRLAEKCSRMQGDIDRVHEEDHDFEQTGRVSVSAEPLNLETPLHRTMR